MQDYNIKKGSNRERRRFSLAKKWDEREVDLVR